MSFNRFSGLLSRKSSLQCWELENSGVYTFEEKHLSTPDKIWGASVDYLAMINAIQKLALTSPVTLGAMERSRSLHQLICRNKPFRIPGPLTTEGNDLDLMVFLYGNQYYQYLRVHALVVEEFEHTDKWISAYEKFVGGVIQSIDDEHSDAGTGNCTYHISGYSSHNLVHSATSAVPETLLGALQGVHESMKSRADLSTSPRYVASSTKDAILAILASVQQQYLEYMCGKKATAFNQTREAAQMARDLRQGANLPTIAVVDAIATMRRSNTKPQISQKLCSHFARELYQLPSPAFQRSLPLPFTYLSLEVLDISCQLRSRMFAFILLKDFERLGINPCAKFRRNLLAALATLPLYLETEGITSVTEQVCMLVSHFAPVDFDHLDAVYDKVIYLLVRDDERIDQLLCKLQDLTTQMLDPLSTPPIELMNTYSEFLPIVEQVCHISCAAFSVYWPIYEAICDMVT